MSPSVEMRWFRAWTDILDDPKLLLLSPDDRWYYIAICALKRTGLLDEPDSTELRDRKVALRLRLDHRERDEVRRRLVEVRLIDENWQPLGWDKRQCESDQDRTAADRQRRHREKVKGERVTRDRHGDVTRDVTVSVTSDCHGGVTTPDTEQIQSRAETDPQISSSKTRKKSVRAKRAATEIAPDLPLDEQWRRYAVDRHPDCDPDAAFEQFKSHHQARGTESKDWFASWRTWVGNFSKYGYPKKRSSEPQMMFAGRPVEWQ